MEEHLDHFVRLALGEILVGQLLHGADEGRDGRSVFPGVAVGFALVRARDRIQRRHQQKSQNCRHQDDERQVSEVVEPGIERRKPVLGDHKTQDHIDQPEGKERNADLGEDALQNVLVDVVSEFVSQDSFDLVVVVDLQQACRKE